MIGCRITDSVLVAHELVRGYNRSVHNQQRATEVDLMQAFDSVDWRFIFQLLSTYGFPWRFLQWTAACITSPYLSICVNGSLMGYFLREKVFSRAIPCFHLL